MPSSGYAAWSVIAGEQPTTSKWNLLGSNDASFNTGNGFNDGILVARHFANLSVLGSAIASYNTNRKNNGTGINETAAHIETGWGAITAGSTTSVLAQAVTFQTAFTNVPIIFVNPGGDQASGSQVLGNGGNTVQGAITGKHYSDTINGFTAYLNAPSGSWVSGNIAYYTWLAVGT